MWSVAVLCCCILNSHALRFETEAVRENIEQGRAKYEELKYQSGARRGSVVAECWTNAVIDLEESCSQLDEENMARLAYSLLTCHLKQHRRAVTVCTNDMEVETCTGSLPDTMFVIYSSFVMHTHNMCFYLQSTAWQARLDHTVDRLKDNSDRVAGNLEVQAEKQDTLMIAMDAVSDLNTDILSKTEKLQAFIHYMVALIEKIGYIQQTFYDHISTYERLIFYGGCLVVVLLTTSFPGVNRARVFLLFVTAASYALEQAVLSLYQDDVLVYKIQRQIRRAWLAVCVYKWVRCFISGDSDTINTQSILNETKETKEMVQKLSAKLSRSFSNDNSRVLALFSDSEGESSEEEDRPVIIKPQQYRRTPASRTPIKSYNTSRRTPVNSPARCGGGRYNLRPTPARSALPLTWISGDEDEESDSDYTPRLDISQI